MPCILLEEMNITLDAKPKPNIHTFEFGQSEVAPLLYGPID